jgi:hypothetical protein
VLVDAELLEDHVSALCAYTLILLDINVGYNGDRVGHIDGGWRPSVGEGRGVVCASRHLDGCSPCLCQLRTEGLVPVSKY